MKKKFLPQINKGATACIVAPSYGTATIDEVNDSLNSARNIVEEYGLNPLFYPNLISPGNHTLFDNPNIRFANSDEVRANQLIDAFNNPNCDLVWSFRGGYGAIRLLPYLNNATVPQTIKPFIGFSDITILHSYINDVWHWPSIHFGMPGSLKDVMQREDTKKSFQDIIFGEKQEATFKLKSLNTDLLHYSKITGITSGGNVLCFEKILGTKYSPSLDNKIIVFEDVGEPPRKIDGFLQKLQMTQGSEEIKAVIFATFTPDENKDIFEKVFKDFAENSKIPTFILDPDNTIGHGDVNNAFPLGSDARITLNEDGFELNILLGMEMITQEEL